MRRRAIFLDRDGTLNVDAGFTHRVEDLRLVDGVVPGLGRLQDLGFALVITTNQSGIARGYFSEADALAFNAALVARLRSEGITIAAVFFCPFHPTAGLGRYRCDSPLRKPKPGMILVAAAELAIELSASFAIGDKESDVLAGQAAGCRTIRVRSGAGGQGEANLGARPDFLADDLPAAAACVERLVRTTGGVPRHFDSVFPAGPEKSRQPLRKRA